MTRRKRDIPVLTDAVPESTGTAETVDDDRYTELRDTLTSRIHALVDELMRAANEQLSDLLRQELPVLVESVLRETLAEMREPD